ncbi:aminotransferase class I/II-fold pyridoxal phosphate-dependent enzyme [Saxibacter everestensis]|uniref:Aminotransferase class I/II-fold pyridoxal phosphate-dependent enzyme n=1 Tax=Saxibacter everestensis TaxID=2909229 RepID=A0ABY8QRT3_9MICO|nr:aminotransferase class I/II-fold pyridoxal phosphate-dependent enzyme [Brevibacteriaceae bacterium ZFBP1038]
MNFAISLSKPQVGPAEEAALLRAFRSGWVAPAGPELDLFEQELAVATGRQHAVALSSGTAALHLALLCHDVGPGDVVFCSTMTFAATANAVVYTGATPYFIDCDETGNMDPELLAAAFDTVRAEGRRVAAVVPVDLLGKVADYDTICRIADRHGVPVIADSAESLGASRNGRPAGCFGNCAIFSFNGNKIITSSGGGALVCDDKTIADRARYLATQARQPVSHYEHADIGYNYRLSNLLAALGRAQLARLTEFAARRRDIRRRYRQVCEEFQGIEIFGGDDVGDNCWLSAIIVDPVLAGFDVDGLAATLHGLGTETRPLWKPMHLQPVFADPGPINPAAQPRRHRAEPPRSANSMLNGTSEHYFRCGITLPSGSGLSDREISTVLRQLVGYARQHGKVHAIA